jgi:hypothetical protein
MSNRFASLAVCVLISLLVSPDLLAEKVVKIGKGNKDKDRVKLSWGSHDYDLCTTKENPGFCGEDGDVQFLDHKGNVTTDRDKAEKVICEEKAVKDCKKRGAKCDCEIFRRHDKDARTKEKQGKNKKNQDDIDTFKHDNSYDKRSEYKCLCVKP